MKLEEVPAKFQNGSDGTKKDGDEKERDNEYNKVAVADTEATRKAERKDPEEAVRTEAASEKDGRQEEEKETTSEHKE